MENEMLPYNMTHKCVAFIYETALEYAKICNKKSAMKTERDFCKDMKIL